MDVRPVVLSVPNEWVRHAGSALVHTEGSVAGALGFRDPG